MPNILLVVVAYTLNPGNEKKKQPDLCETSMVYIVSFRTVTSTYDTLSKNKTKNIQISFLNNFSGLCKE